MKIVKRQKKELEQLVEKRTAEVVARNEEILSQKDQINDLFDDMRDSIRAAKSVQESILPSKSKIESILPNSFIYYKPKDIVSGDFYWIEEKNEKIIIAAADCTGHGVGGAFMSINGHHLLNKTVYMTENASASQILERLNHELIRELEVKPGEAWKTGGMDIALCIIDKNRSELEFAGAKSPLYIVRDNELLEFKPDKFSIGFSVKGNHPSYTSHTISLKKNDILYLFSDGYADQFGGVNADEKLMYPRFRELLKLISPLPMEEQLTSLDKAHNEWKGSTQQLDDILVIGIRI